MQAMASLAELGVAQAFQGHLTRTRRVFYVATDGNSPTEFDDALLCWNCRALEAIQ